MSMNIYFGEWKIDFNNSLYADQYVKNQMVIDTYETPKIEFSALHNLLNEKNKYYLELAFQAELKESI